MTVLFNASVFLVLLGLVGATDSFAEAEILVVNSRRHELRFPKKDPGLSVETLKSTGSRTVILKGRSLPPSIQLVVIGRKRSFELRKSKEGYFKVKLPIGSWRFVTIQPDGRKAESTFWIRDISNQPLERTVSAHLGSGADLTVRSGFE